MRNHVTFLLLVTLTVVLFLTAPLFRDRDLERRRVIRGVRYE